MARMARHRTPAIRHGTSASVGRTAGTRLARSPPDGPARGPGAVDAPIRPMEGKKLHRRRPRRRAQRALHGVPGCGQAQPHAQGLPTSLRLFIIPAIRWHKSPSSDILDREICHISVQIGRPSPLTIKPLRQSAGSSSTSASTTHPESVSARSGRQPRPLRVTVRQTVDRHEMRLVSSLRHPGAKNATKQHVRGEQVHPYTNNRATVQRIWRTHEEK